MNVYAVDMKTLVDEYDFNGNLYYALDTLLDDCAMNNGLTRCELLDVRDSVFNRCPMDALEYMGIYGGAAWVAFVSAVECIADKFGFEC